MPSLPHMYIATRENYLSHGRLTKNKPGACINENLKHFTSEFIFELVTHCLLFLKIFAVIPFRYPPKHMKRTLSVLYPKLCKESRLIAVLIKIIHCQSLTFNLAVSPFC